MNLSQSEIYFNNLRANIQKASTVNDIIEALTERTDEKIKDQCRKMYRRYFNIKFKGNLEKSRAEALIEVNRQEHDFEELKIFDAFSNNPVFC